MLRALFALLVVYSPAHAWNALGHKVIADIAWQELEPTKREQIADTIRRHPRFGEDFIRQMPDELVSAEKAIQDRWFFQHAATWADLIRGNPEYDQPTWHYVNLPLFLDGELPINVNRSMDYPTRIEKSQWNVGQAIKHCQAALNSRAGQETKALAYCWLFHLVGDVHQPMHSTALFSEHFPNGDRGGNEIPLARGRNLHSLWDNLLGRQHYMRDVEREIIELRADRDAWNVEQGNVETWIAESHELATSVAYDAIILDAVRQAQVGVELQPIVLPETYMQNAGRMARLRVVAAGVRLGRLLD